ncbi:MAG: sigma-70 family RNA polymerase sigma factor, partial [Actinomycetota bacterium]|nr:sigma-70 family RNA polymerase sigma factor [Actinomycetota bacterium]
MSVHGSNGGGPTGDGALAAAFVAGDAAAFSALYERYVSRIYDFVRRTVRDQAAAEDLTQATFVQAYERRASLRDPAAVRAWLYRIAHNAAINHVTRSRMADELDELSAPPSTKPGPEEVAVQRESADLVWDAAASLEPRQYAVLDLTVRKGLTNAEVAEVLGVDAAQASVAVFRAREALGNAVRFLLVARRRRHCDRLADLVPEGVRQLTAAQRASVDRHLRRCPTCQRMAMALTAPDQLFAALPLLAVPAALRHAPQIVPTAVATGLPPAGGPRPGAHLARNLVAGTAIGAVIAAAIVAGVVVTRNPPTRTPPTRAAVAAEP